ncbi:hypothetical protein GCM10009824_21240 [Kocuria atrinae]|uniref:Uncharacterized protein n=1 Tax=Kocuria atrinae TaxID=592377 RepID=A0ABN2Y237_9MICC
MEGLSCLRAFHSLCSVTDTCRLACGLTQALSALTQFGRKSVRVLIHSFQRLAQLQEITHYTPSGEW